MKMNKEFGLVLVVITILLISSIFYFKEKKFQPENNTINNYTTTNPEGENENPTSAQEQNGEYLGYIKDVSLSNGNYSLTIDYIQWQDCSNEDYTDDDCPNGFRILNTNPKLRTFAISNNVVIEMQTFSHQTSGIDKGNYNSGELISLSQFKGLIDGTVLPPTYLTIEEEMGFKPNPYVNYWPEHPFWITLNNGVITEVAEKYVP